MNPTVVSLFSGAGGMDLGFTQAGFDVLWANDHDPAACQTHRLNFKSVIVQGSIKDIDAGGIPDADVVIGGPPCQGFSESGKMDPKDPRSQLVWEFFRVVKAKRPRWFVMENGIFLDALLGAFADDGWKLKFSTLDASEHGVPQNRKRFFLVGSQNREFTFPVPLKTKISVREALKGLDLPGQGLNQGLCRAKIEFARSPELFRTPYIGLIFNGRSGRPLDPARPSGTLLASGGNQTPIIDQELLDDPNADSWLVKLHADLVAGFPPPATIPPQIRRLTIRELARLQGFPDDFIFAGPQTCQQAQIGNSVPPPLARRIAEQLLVADSSAHQEPDSILSMF